VVATEITGTFTGLLLVPAPLIQYSVLLVVYILAKPKRLSDKSFGRRDYGRVTCVAFVTFT